jgi:tetratricopeptide repeat protein 21B
MGDLSDHESIQELQAKLTINSNATNLSERALIQVALFHWLTGSHTQAKQFLKKVIEAAGGTSGRGSVTASSLSSASNTYSLAVAFTGCIDLTGGQDGLAAKSISWFDRVLESNPRDLDVRSTCQVFKNPRMLIREQYINRPLWGKCNI